MDVARSLEMTFSWLRPAKNVLSPMSRSNRLRDGSMSVAVGAMRGTGMNLRPNPRRDRVAAGSDVFPVRLWKALFVNFEK